MYAYIEAVATKRQQKSDKRRESAAQRAEERRAGDGDRLGATAASLSLASFLAGSWLAAEIL
jgi:hypothetical protein